MSTASGGSAFSGSGSPVPEEAVLAQLDRILAAPNFVHSARISRFLRVAVERTLAGQAETLKEFSLGVDVYNRRPDYNPATDSIVRVEAQRLRRKLSEYYNGEGREDPVRIAFRPGSYVPAFSWAEKPAAVEPAAPPAADPNTVAALPFENLSSDPELTLFCGGITEEIIHSLASLRGLRVLGLTTVTAMQASAEGLLATCRRLGVGTLVEGSVRKSGDRLRISAKVVAAGSGRTRWSRRFDRRIEDTFSIQDDIAREVALALRPPEPPAAHAWTKGPAAPAYILYLKGRLTLDDGVRESCTEAIGCFQQSVAMAPDFALPYCGLAQVYQWMAFLGWMRPSEAYPEARQAALEALRLDSQSADAHAALANTLLRFERDWKGAAAAASHALNLNPSCGLAYSTLGNCALLEMRFDEAISAFERAVQLDPLSPRTAGALGIAYWLAGNAVTGEHWLRMGLRLSPNATQARTFLVRLLLSAGRVAEALDLAKEETPSPIVLFLGARAAAYAANGDPEEARRILRELEERSQTEYVDAAAMVLIHGSLGDWDAAFACLAKALEERAPMAEFFRIDPLFASRRDDPRFRALEAAYGG